MEIFPGMIDVWGQLPRMKGYTHLAACFPHPASISRGTIIEHLEAATRQITSTLPWLGGAVVSIKGSPESTGTGSFTVARSLHTENILKVQDRSEDCPSFQEIFEAKSASNQLMGPLLSNESAMPDTYTETEDNPAPVLTLTANWIEGGLVLDCAAQHNILDIGGIDQFFQLLAAALQGKKLNEASVDANTRDRASIFPLLSPEEMRQDHSAMRCPSCSIPSQRKPPSTKLQSSFHYVRFNATSLSHLAALAKTPSTDDALSAFIWKRLSSVRHKNQRSDAVTGFSRAIDCRKTLRVPKEYMGVVVVKTASRMTFQEIEEASLEDIAAQLRRDVRRIRNEHFLRSLATLMATEADKSTFNFVSGFDPDTWVNASSWAGAATHRLDYGILGKPAFVQRPQSKPVQGSLYFLPLVDNGDLDALLCLKDDEIRGLRDDVEWCRHAEYIG